MTATAGSLVTWLQTNICLDSNLLACLSYFLPALAGENSFVRLHGAQLYTERVSSPSGTSSFPQTLHLCGNGTNPDIKELNTAMMDILSQELDRVGLLRLSLPLKAETIRI